MKKILIFLSACLMLGKVASAAVIVDTGPGSTGSGGWSLDSSQWLAAEFSIDQTYVITDVEGWIGGGNGGLGTVAIYDDGGSIPGTEIFSTGFTADWTDSWYGASGLSWLLSAGTYWSVFEVRAGDTLDAWMGNPAVTPLGNEAFFSVGGGSWSGSSTLDMGVRISATQAGSVPEPATLALMMFGLAGLGFWQKNKRNIS